MNVHENLEAIIGETPLVGLSRLTAGLPGQVLVKLEYLNPLGSLKDRIARQMLDDAERRGLPPGARLIEATSGNTGISLASLCAARGYPLTVVMPETMSLERRTLLLLYGVRVVLTPAELGLRGALAKVHELITADPRLVFINQGANLGNPRAHETTAREIWRDTDGQVDTVVVGAGTGGTYRGMLRFFQTTPGAERVRLVAVEPSESPVLSGGEVGPHGIQGIGAGVIVPHLRDLERMEIQTVSTVEAIRTARRVMRQEGLPVGISSGAAITVALRLAQLERYRGRLIVTLASSCAERYLSTELAEEERQLARQLPVSALQPETLSQLDQVLNSYLTSIQRAREEI